MSRVKCRKNISRKIGISKRVIIFEVGKNKTPGSVQKETGRLKSKL